MREVEGNIIGHFAQRKYLSLLLKLDIVPSALLFVGRESIGKRRVAKEWFKNLLCENRTGCGRCRGCVLLAAGSHPDAYLLEKGNDEILIDDIRTIQEFVSKRPYYGKRKCVLIDNAENLNQTAANAFLKILEEPPADTTFVLISSSLYKVIPTIRSRCLILRFSPVKDRCLSASDYWQEGRIYEGSFSPLVKADKTQLREIFDNFISPGTKKSFVLKDRKNIKESYRIIGIWLHDILVSLLREKEIGYNVILGGKWEGLDDWIAAGEYFFDSAYLLDFANLGIIESRLASSIRVIRK